MGAVWFHLNSPYPKYTSWVTQKAGPIWQNIQFSNMKCIQSDCSILGISIHGLVSHIIIVHNMRIRIYKPIYCALHVCTFMCAIT